MSTKAIELRFNLGHDASNPPALETIVGQIKTAIEGIQETDVVVREHYADRPGTMGPEWLPILTAVLSAPAVSVAIQAIADIVKKYFDNDPSLTVVFAVGDDRVTMSATNLDSSLLERLVGLVRAT